MKNVVVVGSQWGDEGKGKIVDWLSSEADVVVRFQGGHNAGHTLVIDKKVFKLRLLPSGIVRNGKISILGNGVVIDPWALLSEIEEIKDKGVEVTPENFMISDTASLILPFHQEMDEIREDAAGKSKIGTTRRGIGPCYEDKVGRRSIRVMDLGSESNLDSSIVFIQGDLTDPEILQRVENIDVVYHLASQASGQVSWESPALDVKANVLATMNVLSWCLEKSVKKFIFTSTMGVYENASSEIPVDESYSLAPASIYGVNKLACEHYIRIFQQSGLDCTIFRLFNVYGPGQNLENSKQGMVSIYLSQMLQSNLVVVKGSSKRFRDFVYIDDVVDALILGLCNSASNEIFNVCTGQKTKVETLLSLIEECCYKTGSHCEISYEGSTPKDIFGCFGSNKKIKEKLGWLPKTHLSTGLQHMVEWGKASLDC